MLSVLLGAGASYEAGLPLATRLTDELIDSIEPYHKLTLEFVRSMMRAQKAVLASQRFQRDPSDIDIDSEALYNTVHELVNRDSLEISPFVTMWHPMLTQLGPKVDVSQLATALNNALNASAGITLAMALTPGTSRYTRPSLNSAEAQSAAKLIAEMVNGKPLDQRILSDMQRCVLEQVRVDEATPVEYLSPLADLAKTEGRLTIGTLNYDTTIETLCSRHDLACSDGIQDETTRAEFQRRALHFAESGVRLFKLHGSTSWGRAREAEQIVHVTEGAGQLGDVVRFGGRNKLTADWPFFDLFWHWQEELRKADMLWIIGYSFRDDHINAIIESWFRSDAGRKVAIVDPQFKVPGGNPFGQDLQSASTDSQGRYSPSPNGVGNTGPIPLMDDEIRIAILRSGAGDALGPLVEAYPNLPIEYARSTKLTAWWTNPNTTS